MAVSVGGLRGGYNTARPSGGDLGYLSGIRGFKGDAGRFGYGSLGQNYGGGMDPESFGMSAPSPSAWDTMGVPAYFGATHGSAARGLASGLGPWLPADPTGGLAPDEPAGGLGAKPNPFLAPGPTFPVDSPLYSQLRDQFFRQNFGDRTPRVI